MQPRCPHAHVVLAAAGLALLLATGDARADVGFNGYLSERLQLTMPHDDALISTQDLAIFQSLSEANLQARYYGMDDRLYIYADVSAFASFAGGYADRGDNNRLQFVKEHDVAQYRPFVVISEAYGQYDFSEHLSVTVGKKRVVWGSGQAFNPADVLNPPRDPTDPSFQRAGAYMLKVDAPFEHFTLTALASPAVLYSNAGIPYAVFMYPGYPPVEHVRNPTLTADPRDNQPHYAVAARLYALVKEADINAWLVYSNRYRDTRENLPQAAFSFSRYFFKDYEFHVEALAQLGSARTYANPACTFSQEAALACAQSGQPLQIQRYRDAMDFLPKMLFGTRTMLKDESFISVEYLFQADGYTPSEFQDTVRLQKRAGTFMRAGGVPPVSGSSGASSGNELPLRFQFEPLRRHYLLASWLKTRVMDDWTVNITGIMGLEDFSATLNGYVQWNAQEWLNLGVYAFLPIPSPTRLSSLSGVDPVARVQTQLGDYWGQLVPAGAEVDGERYGEYDALPFRGRLVAEARVFF